jgi:Domain of unknown function (DUF6371)
MTNQTPQSFTRMSVSSFPYSLEKSPKKKGDCPQCGHKGKFRYYEDRNGDRIESAGKCERVNECDYHIKPNQEQIKGILTQTFKPKSEPPQIEIIFPDKELLAKIEGYEKDQSSNFHKFCSSLDIPLSHLQKWGVATQKNDTVFILRNKDNKVANTKNFRYLATGKRDKSFNSFSLKQPKNDAAKYGIPLFGEHLLDAEKNKIVCVVESEKSAVIVSWFYPDFDFVACGAANGLTAEKLSVLFGRKIYWLADADKAGRDNSSIKNLKAYEQNFEVIDLFPDREDGFDLADAIIEKIKVEIPDWQVATKEQALTVEEEPKTIEKARTRRYTPIQKGLPNIFWYEEETQKHFDEWNFVEYEGRYWFGKYSEDDGTYTFKPVSNFIIKPVLLIQSVSNPKRIFEIKNTFNSKKLLNLEPMDFTSLGGFTKRIESVGNFLLDGCSTGQFTKIKAKLYQESVEAQEIKTLGHQTDNFYAFSNGIVTEGKFQPIDENGYGIVTHEKKQYFIPSLSKIYKDDENEYPNQKKFIYKEGTITFEEYGQMFCQVHGSNGRIGLLYYLSALFRDIVFERLRFFPHLYLFGQPQSGKTTMALSVLYLFGQIRTAFALGTGTMVGFYKHFAEFRNAVVWFDEYKNSIDYQRVQSLKTAYDGNGHTKSDNTADNRNKSIPIYSGCIISGQDLPTADPALFTRCILLMYGKTEYSIEEKKALNDFHSLGESLQIAHLTAQMVTHRHIVKTNFFKVFDQVCNSLKAKFPNGIDDRIVKNMGILLTTYEVLKGVLKFPFSDDEIMETFLEVMRKQNAQISSSKETATFWKMVAFMNANRQIHLGTDYLILEKATIQVYKNGSNETLVLDNGNLKKVIFIRFTKIHPLYMENFRKQYNQVGLDEGSIRHYLENSSAYLGAVRNQKFKGTPTSCIAYDYELLTQTIEGFEINKEEEDKDDEKTQSSDNQDIKGF